MSTRIAFLVVATIATVALAALMFAGARLRTTMASSRATSIGLEPGVGQGPAQTSVHWFMREDHGARCLRLRTAAPAALMPDAPSVLAHEFTGGANNAVLAGERTIALRGLAWAVEGAG